MSLKNSRMHKIGMFKAKELYKSIIFNSTLESLMNDVDWYKKYAIEQDDDYFNGLADGLTALIENIGRCRHE